MIRRPPTSTLTDTLFPYTPLFRSGYAGFNSPLFDLGGLASNNQLAPAQEDWMLEAYFERPVDDSLRRRYQAMKCASLLRETLWSMVSEIHSDIDFDYRAYTADNLARFQAAVQDFQQRSEEHTSEL